MQLDKLKWWMLFSLGREAVLRILATCESRGHAEDAKQTESLKQPAVRVWDSARWAHADMHACPCDCSGLANAVLRFAAGCGCPLQASRFELLCTWRLASPRAEVVTSSHP